MCCGVGEGGSMADQVSNPRSGSDSQNSSASSSSSDEGTGRQIQDLAKRLRSGRRRGKQKVDHSWDRIIKRSNEHLLAFSLTGLLASVILSYFKWYSRCCLYLGRCYSYGEPPPGQTTCPLVIATIDNTEWVPDLPGGASPPVDFSKTVYPPMLFLQIVISFSTAVSIYKLTQLYDLHLQERRREWSGFEEIDLINDDGNGNDRKDIFEASYNFWRSSLRWQYFVEVLIHAFHPVVWVESYSIATQTIYEISQSFIFLRLYLLFRVLYINSSIYQQRDEIVRNNRELQISGYQVSMISTAKIVFYQHPIAVMVSMVVSSVVVMGFWIFVTERDNNPMFDKLENGYWFVWVSLATIGYGDYVPITTSGRLVCVLIAFTSLFITTVFSGIVTNLVSPSREQRLVTSYLAKHKSTAVYRKSAVELLVHAVRFRMNKGSLSIGSRRPPQLYAAMKKFQHARMAVRESLGAANDPVMDGKLVNAVVDAWALNRGLDDQAAEIDNVEKALAKTVKRLKDLIKAQAHQGSQGAQKHRSPSEFSSTSTTKRR